jgi:3-oxoacyl-[acyl-carrier protein] reductase
MIDLTGQCALITGAGNPGGIGFAAARALAEAGARIVLTSTTPRIFERQAELGRDALAFTADLADAAAANGLVAATLAAVGRIDILVNNAGMVQTGVALANSRLHEMDDAEWRGHLDLNLSSAFFMTRAVLAHMRERAYGRIVNVASVTGPLVTNPGMAGYSAAKAGMVGLTRAGAIENAKLNITVNAVAPGWIASASQGPQEARAGLATPAGRSGSPDEIAAVIAFLASPQASYVTGQMIVADGGNSIQEFKGDTEDWY